MRKGSVRGLGQQVLVGTLASLAFQGLASFLHWDEHLGVEAQMAWRLVWFCLAALLLAGLVGLIRFYVREYWDVFFNDRIASQEERNGLQR